MVDPPLTSRGSSMTSRLALDRAKSSTVQPRARLITPSTHDSVIVSSRKITRKIWFAALTTRATQRASPTPELNSISTSDQSRCQSKSFPASKSEAPLSSARSPSSPTLARLSSGPLTAPSSTKASKPSGSWPTSPCRLAPAHGTAAWQSSSLASWTPRAPTGSERTTLLERLTTRSESADLPMQQASFSRTASPRSRFNGNILFIQQEPDSELCRSLRSPSSFCLSLWL